MGILRGEKSGELRLFRGELMADLGFSMKMEQGKTKTNATERRRIRTRNQKNTKKEINGQRKTQTQI